MTKKKKKKACRNNVITKNICHNKHTLSWQKTCFVIWYLWQLPPMILFKQTSHEGNPFKTVHSDTRVKGGCSSSKLPMKETSSRLYTQTPGWKALFKHLKMETSLRLWTKKTVDFCCFLLSVSVCLSVCLSVSLNKLLKKETPLRLWTKKTSATLSLSLYREIYWPQPTLLTAMTAM